jgi:hypothetical protein
MAPGGRDYVRSDLLEHDGLTMGCSPRELITDLASRLVEMPTPDVGPASARTSIADASEGQVLGPLRLV